MSTVKENVAVKHEKAAKPDKIYVNPVDPVTGKRKRGRPAKVKPQTAN